MAISRIANLRRKLIRLSSTGSYTDAQYIDAQAFVVLAHAALEEYLERIVLEVVDSGIIAFNTKSATSHCLVALVTYTENKAAPTESRVGPWSLIERVKAARQALWHDIDNNHGLREPNVVPLLLRAGLKESDMSRIWLDNMNNLGSLRGRIAHTTNGPGASSPDDPGDVLAAVTVVLPALCRIDSKLMKLKV